MILGGDFHEETCCKWSGIHRGTTNWVWDITMVVILGVILTVVKVILMTEMVLEGDSYEKSCWK